MTPRQSKRTGMRKRLLSESSSEAEIFVISDSELSDGSATYLEGDQNVAHGRGASQPAPTATLRRAAGSKEAIYRQPEVQLIAQVKTNAIWTVSSSLSTRQSYGIQY